MHDDILEDLWTDIDSPLVCGQLLMGQPHGVWLHFHGDQVRITRWEHGELVEVISGLVDRPGHASSSRAS